MQTAVDAISTSLQDATLESQELLSASRPGAKTLTLPFEQEKLLIKKTGADGKGVRVRTTIGERMAAFERAMGEELGRMRVLWARWKGINDRIGALLVTSDTVGVEGDEETAGREEGYAERYRKLDEEYQRKRDEILKKLGSQCEGMVDDVRKSELVSLSARIGGCCCLANGGVQQYEKRRKDQQVRFMEYLNREMEEDE